MARRSRGGRTSAALPADQARRQRHRVRTPGRVPSARPHPDRRRRKAEGDPRNLAARRDT
ncbi:hypothetical protein SGPA1_30766 [Streptomyces misionensis JCM 4497]